MNAPAQADCAVSWVDPDAVDERFVSQWSRLAERDPDGSLFQTPEWMLTWLRHFGGERARLLVVRRADELVGLMPLQRRRIVRFGLPVSMWFFAGEPAADRLGALGDPDVPGVFDALVKGLSASLASVAGVCLSEMTRDCRFERALERLAASRGVRTTVRTCARSPVLSLAPPWEVMEAGYPKSLRTRLARARRKQAKAGRIAFRRWQPEPEELADLLPGLADLERRSWKGRKGVGIFSPDPRWRFVVDLSERLAARRWLDVATLALDGRLIAYRYGFRFRARFLDYNLAHDPDMAGLSPGRVLLDEIIRDSHRLGLEAVDASRGGLDPPHLLADWTDCSRYHRRWRLFAPSLSGRWLFLVERRAATVWRRIKGSDERMSTRDGPRGSEGRRASG